MLTKCGGWVGCVFHGRSISQIAIQRTGEISGLGLVESFDVFPHQGFVQGHVSCAGQHVVLMVGQ